MFEIDSKVVCVDDKFPEGIHDYYNALPVKGHIYTVRDLVSGQGFDLSPQLTVLLHELVNRPNNHGIEPGFKCERFREPEVDESEVSEKVPAFADA